MRASRIRSITGLERVLQGERGEGLMEITKEAFAAGSRVQFDRPVSGIAAALGHDPSGDWKQVFVYRRNSLIGGRAHGVKFNGTRAWIADNHFENINGNAILAGYTSEVSGHGAREVVVSGNTIIHCGWTPIEALSTSGLGGSILVRGNRITETRDAAISIRGCGGVTVSANTFESSLPPKLGAWIVAEKAPVYRLLTISASETCGG